LSLSKNELIKSSSILKFRLNSFSALFFAFLLDHFFIHDRNHFIWLVIYRWSPFLSAISPFFNGFSINLLLFFFFFDAYVTMNPVYLIFFTFISKSSSFLNFSWLSRFTRFFHLSSRRQRISLRYICCQTPFNLLQLIF